MAYSHIAHCCNIGNQVIIANAVQIAGHVTVEDQATIEGMVGIVQFLRIKDQDCNYRMIEVSLLGQYSIIF